MKLWFVFRFFFLYRTGWDGENWVKNGPLLLTNLLKEQCGTVDVVSMYSSNATCTNFTVFPPDAFGPIPWYNWEDFFDLSKVDFVREKINNSMAVHFWNRMTKEQKILPQSHQPYADIAKKYCPNVFTTVIQYF